MTIDDDDDDDGVLGPPPGPVGGFFMNPLKLVKF